MQCKGCKSSRTAFVNCLYQWMVLVGSKEAADSFFFISPHGVGRIWICISYVTEPFAFNVLVKQDCSGHLLHP